jgi:glycine hydroxymethyltransferase
VTQTLDADRANAIAGLSDRMQPLATSDPEISRAVRQEIERQNDGLELIASENFTSAAVLEAMGSPLTNKYAEGYPGRRYYGGCEYVDVAESLAIDRAKALFGAEHANVQPHSGAQANMAAYFALLKPGQTVLGMNLAHGGHLTHGHPLNFSGQLYEIVPYGVRRDDERIDYDALEQLARQHRPGLIMVGASAYSRVIDFARIAGVAEAVGAAVVTDMAHIAGLVATGLHPSPVPYSDVVTTTTHKTLRGPRGGLILCRETHRKAINRSLFPGVQGGPLMHVVAAKAVCFKEAATRGFADYQRQVVRNARRLAGALADQGFRIVSGGTDNHLLLVDVFSRGLTGTVCEAALGRAGITVNKNAIPFDQQPPMVASGIRLGTPALTTRGMAETEMDIVAELIGRVLATPEDDRVAAMVRGEVEALCRKFPLYPTPLPHDRT